jgi:hypothetical protein
MILALLLVFCLLACVVCGLQLVWYALRFVVGLLLLACSLVELVAASWPRGWA